MDAVSPIAQPVVSRTFLVGVSLLGGVALGMATALLVLPLRPPANLALPASAVADAGGSKGSASTTTPEAEEAALVAATAEERLVANLSQPTPPPVTRESMAQDLLVQARELRDRGDMTTALVHLREAQGLLPRNPEIIAEMANIYEKMGLVDKALGQWRRLYETGDDSEGYFSMASDHLRALQLPEDGDEPVTASSGAEPLPEDWTPEPETAHENRMTLGEMKITDDSGKTKTARRFKLHVPILAQPGGHIAVRDVTIQVYFYDQLKDGSVVQTDANVLHSWAANPSWATGEPEVLEVSYLQPEPSKKADARNYFGYVVRVYYKKALNASRAEPESLLTQFPPPETLSTAVTP